MVTKWRLVRPWKYFWDEGWGLCVWWLFFDLTCEFSALDFGIWNVFQMTAGAFASTARMVVGLFSRCAALYVSSSKPLGNILLWSQHNKTLHKLVIKTACHKLTFRVLSTIEKDSITLHSYLSERSGNISVWVRSVHVHCITNISFLLIRSFILSKRSYRMPNENDLQPVTVVNPSKPAHEWVWVRKSQCG